MIRINLLGTERQPKARTKTASSFDIGQRLTVACSLILVAAFVGIGWWFWTLNNETARLDAEIVARQQEAARLQSLLAEVQRFEAQRGQLQQRVQLIEQLRGGQSIPVQLLDHVSRSLPDMMWLTEMTQDGAALTIQGRSTTLIALSDFVGNLGNGALLKKPIEIVNSQVDTTRAATGPGATAVELINFTVKAELAAVGRAGGAGAVAAGRGAPPPPAAR
jgi:type IV pilus assembly protein PilN